MSLHTEVADLFQSESTQMSDLLTVELDKEQREVILRGLRYVRSSVMLTPQDPTPQLAEGRSEELQKLVALSDLLSGQEIAENSPV